MMNGMPPKAPTPPLERPPYDPGIEMFQLADPNGLQTPLRNVSDEELIKAWNIARANVSIAQKRVAVAIEGLMQAQGSFTLVSYEYDRKRRSGIVLRP